MSRVNNFIVNNNEAERLKEMIFNRAREHAQSYTDDAQKEIMDIAHDTFVSKNNPFSKIAAGEKEVKAEVEKNEVAENRENLEIGFPQKQKFVPQKTQQQVINEQIINATIQSNMIEARNELQNKSGFMGALNFLNSQAAASLVRTKADKFDIIV